MATLSRKSLALALAGAFVGSALFSPGSEAAGRFGGFRRSRGRSIGRIVNRSPRIGRSIRTPRIIHPVRKPVVRHPIGNIGKRIGRTPIGKRIGRFPIGKKIGKFPVGKKIGKFPIGKKIGKSPIGKKIGKFPVGKTWHHGHHGHHGHHHHKHGWGWRRWLFGGYHGWGLVGGYGWGNCYFDYCYTPPVVDYCNPYCDDLGPGEAPGYDYSEPVSGQGPSTDAGMNQIDAAAEAFTRGDYKTALALSDKAAKEMPQNADLHQFRSLVLFAMGQYRESAAAAHAALMAGQGWNWETLRSFYADKETYTRQLRALEKYTNVNLKDPAGRFLLAYHYLMMGHGEAGAKELVAVVELEPRDKLAQTILKAVGKKLGKEFKPKVQPKPEPENVPQPMETEGPGPVQPSVPTLPPAGSQPVPTPTPTPQPAPKTEARLAEVGTWVAKPEDGVTITLAMQQGGKFSWTVEADGEKTTISGKYTLSGGELKLAGDKAGSPLEGKITVKSKDEFELKMKFQPQDEPGLTFKRK